MKKQKKQLAILLAALVLLAAAIPGARYLNERRAAKEAEAAKAEQDSSVIIDAAYGDIVKFSYDYEGVTYSFEKSGDTWHAAEDASLDIKEYSIESMLSGVSPFTAQQVIEDAADLSQYGLDNPERTIAFETASASYILYVGSQNPITGAYYICMPSEAKVYVVEQAVVTRFNQTLEDVVEAAEPEGSGEQSDDGGASEESGEQPSDGGASEESGEQSGDGGAGGESGEQSVDGGASEESGEQPVDGGAGEESGEQPVDGSASQGSGGQSDGGGDS